MAAFHEEEVHEDLLTNVEDKTENYGTVAEACVGEIPAVHQNPDREDEADGQEVDAER